MAVKVSTKKLTGAALLAASAVIMHSMEALLPPLIIGVPVKLGLANIFTLFAVIRLGNGYAAAITVIRCLVSALITGTVSALPFSLTGALCAFFIMAALKKPMQKGLISPVGMSVAGSFMFNIGQIAVSVLTAGRAMLCYFPLMTLFSVPTGIFTGLTVYFINRLTDGKFKHGRNECGKQTEKTLKASQSSSKSVK